MHVLAAAAGLAVVLAVVCWSVVVISAARPPMTLAVPVAPVPAAAPGTATPVTATPVTAAQTTAAQPSALPPPAAPPAAPGPSSAPPLPPAAAPGRPPVVSEAWLARTAAATGVPARALQAYAVAATVSAAEDPGCGLGWPTLAAIGWVESHHGTIGGRTIDEATGRPSSPVVGVALDGSGVALVADSDGGALDGDASLDRAAGPMQFLPTTWSRWQADADADGSSDVQDLDDAALSAARYLCASGADLASAQGWAAALLSYNRSGVYVQDVTTRANLYATRSRG